MDKSQEIQEGINAFDSFFKQFGPLDVYNRVMWEVLFEELFNVSSNTEEDNNGNGN